MYIYNYFLQFIYWEYDDLPERYSRTALHMQAQTYILSNNGI